MALKPIVKVISKLEEALGSMPNQKMPVEQIQAGLKKRSVQNLEIQQSGFSQAAKPNFEAGVPQLKSSMKPSEALDMVKTYRRDQYEIKTITGKNLKLKDVSKANMLYWENLSAKANGDVSLPLSLTNITDIEETYRRAGSLTPDITSKLNDLRFEVELGAAPSSRLMDRWNSVTTELGLPNSELTRSNITSIKHSENLDILPFGENERLSMELDSILVRLESEEGFTFEDKAFRYVTLPDTDNASYSVNIYKNRAVNPKGYDGDNHWQEFDYVFHTRTDSPEPGVHRIQEIQSDIQNSMTKAKDKFINATEASSEQIKLQQIHSLFNRDFDTPAEEAMLKQATEQTKTIIDDEFGLNISADFTMPTKLAVLEGFGINSEDFLREAMIESGHGRSTVVNSLDSILGTINYENTFQKFFGANFEADILKRPIAEHNKIMREQLSEIVPEGKTSFADAVTSLLENKLPTTTIEQQIFDGAIRLFEIDVGRSVTAIEFAKFTGRKQFLNTVAKRLLRKERLKEIDSSKYTLDVPYIKQGLQSEIVKAMNSGKREVWLAVNPEDVDILNRSVSTQAKYEKEMGKTFKSLAKRVGGIITDENGYLKLTLPVAGLVTSLPLYADTNANDFRSRALADGIPIEDIDAFLAEKNDSEDEVPLAREGALDLGIPLEEIKQYEQEQFVNSLAEKDFADPTRQIESEVPTVSSDVAYYKVPEETVKQIANDIQADPTSPSGIDAIYDEFRNRTNPNSLEADSERAREVLRSDIADFEELYDVDRPFGWMASQVGFGTASEVYKQRKIEDQANIISIGKDRGFDLSFEEDRWFVTTESGQKHDVTPEFLQTMGRVSGEISGGIAGAAAAERATRSFDAIPYGRLARLGAITVGTVAGAMFGDQIDYISAATRQNEEFNSKIAFEKAIGSAEASVLGDVIGLGAIKLVQGVWKGALQAHRALLDGNTQGAYDMLKLSTNLSDDQITEIVTRWEKLNQKEAPTVSNPLFSTVSSEQRKAQEKALAIVPVTRAGGEEIIAATVSKSPKVSARVANEVNQRAQDILDISAQNVDDNLGVLLQKNLDDYIAETNVTYDAVKAQGSDFMPAGYKFDLNKLAIQPLREALGGIIANPAKTEQLLRTLEKIDNLTTSRTFDDLLELRSVVNEFRFGQKLSASNKQMLNNAIAGIDQEISKASTSMSAGSGRIWGADWAEAKLAQNMMNSTTNNVLAKAINKAGTNEKDIAKALVKYGTAIDDTYKNIVSTLPIKTRAKVESSILDFILNKHTVGAEGEFKAIQFPEIAKELKLYDFVGSDAIALRKVANRLADVYQNDIGLAYASGGLSPQQFSTYLTVNPVIRAQYEMASLVFNKAKALAPGGKADVSALVNKVGDLLEKPLNAKSVAEAMKVVKGDQAAEELIKKVQAETARNATTGGPTTTLIKLYKGKGGALHTRPGSGRALIKETIPAQRVTSEEAVLKMLKLDTIGDLTTQGKNTLINNGFLAIGLDDGALFKLN